MRLGENLESEFFDEKKEATCKHVNGKQQIITNTSVAIS